METLEHRPDGSLVRKVEKQTADKKLAKRYFAFDKADTTTINFNFTNGTITNVMPYQTIDPRWYHKK